MKIWKRGEIFDRVQKFLAANPSGVLEILGPTASGKTEFSIQIAQKIESKIGKKCEIVSADSRQIFRDISIASAKILPAEMAGIPHWGIDICDPDEDFSVVDFQKYAGAKITEILARNAVPILVGGTMLWLDSVSENYEFSANPTQKSTKKNPPKWPFFKIGIELNRLELYDRINARARAQFDAGILDEMKKVAQKFPKITRSARTVFGYFELEKYACGEISLQQALEKNQKRNRNYAKRQLTWWRGRSDVFWVSGV